ncbi:hypothetical protein SADUNF_Sadunf18G0005600 [Salix dunnii]|uniref:FBD domain-containing protein n=1 Tax=Salix dunnii TaxID=1413687 RepID=A0A835J589_9ROSI|nr:hypothetical protein SADUNF_Sadunf18G0005600 [Salix dunnii]
MLSGGDSSDLAVKPQKLKEGSTSVAKCVLRLNYTRQASFLSTMQQPSKLGLNFSFQGLCRERSLSFAERKRSDDEFGGQSEGKYIFRSELFEGITKIELSNANLLNFAFGCGQDVVFDFSSSLSLPAKAIFRGEVTCGAILLKRILFSDLFFRIHSEYVHKHQKKVEIGGFYDTSNQNEFAIYLVKHAISLERLVSNPVGKCCSVLRQSWDEGDVKSSSKTA